MDPRDAKSSSDWCIAGVASIGAIVNWYPFDLVNRTAGRAHRLDVVVATAIATPIPTVSTAPPDYTNFQTASDVKFSDFDGVGARVTSLNAGIIYGYGITFLTLWRGPAYFSPLLARLTMTGFAIMLPGGSAAAHGTATVSYGVGVPMGKAPMLLSTSDDFPPTPRHVKWVRIPKGPNRIDAPVDLLFAFDKAVLKPEAENALREISALLNLRSTSRVSIHGYADSVGTESYNHGLAWHRAHAVRDWLVNNKVYGAEKFKVVSHGSHNPAAPNQIAGKDNPQGRALNRRVEVLYE